MHVPMRILRWRHSEKYWKKSRKCAFFAAARSATARLARASSAAAAAVSVSLSLGGVRVPSDELVGTAFSVTAGSAFAFFFNSSIDSSSAIGALPLRDSV